MSEETGMGETAVARKAVFDAIVRLLKMEVSEPDARVGPALDAYAASVRSDAFREAAAVADNHDEAGERCCCDSHLCDVGNAIRNLASPSNGKPEASQ